MSLKTRLHNYLARRPTEWIPKGEIERLVAAHTIYTPENAGRRLRELEVEQRIEVKLINNHAHYRALPDVTEIARQMVQAF